MVKTDNVYISKIDAAKRQLEVSIRLFLSYGDIVATHTLTAASYNLMRDLGKIQEKPVLIKSKMVEMVKPEHRKKFIDKINEAENFFKHAVEDSDKILGFNPEWTEFMLWDACSTYKFLTTESTPLMELFILWFFVKNPDVLGDENIRTTFTNLLSENSVDPKNRELFLKFLPQITRMNF